EEKREKSDLHCFDEVEILRREVLLEVVAEVGAEHGQIQDVAQAHTRVILFLLVRQTNKTIKQQHPKTMRKRTSSSNSARDTIIDLTKKEIPIRTSRDTYFFFMNCGSIDFAACSCTFSSHHMSGRLHDRARDTKPELKYRSLLALRS